MFKSFKYWRETRRHIKRKAKQEENMKEMLRRRDEIHIGDFVYLKGFPQQRMTVSSVHRKVFYGNSFGPVVNETPIVSWIDDNGNFHQEEVSYNALVKCMPL